MIRNVKGSNENKAVQFILKSSKLSYWVYTYYLCNEVNPKLPIWLTWNYQKLVRLITWRKIPAIWFFELQQSTYFYFCLISTEQRAMNRKLMSTGKLYNARKGTIKFRNWLSKISCSEIPVISVFLSIN